MTQDTSVSDWWRTDIIDMEPGRIHFRGYPVQDLIGNISFTQMIWLMTRGELPDEGQAELLDTALMAAVDHGRRTSVKFDSAETLFGLLVIKRTWA